MYHHVIDLYFPPHCPLVYIHTYIYMYIYVHTYTLGEEVVELEHLEGQLRTLMDKFKYQRRELKQTKDDTKV